MTIGAAADTPPSPSAAAVLANQLDLETPAGVGFVKLYCAEVDVLRTEPLTGRVFVRAYLGKAWHGVSVVLEGVVRAVPEHAGWGNCGSRITGLAGYPAHWRAADGTADARARARLAGPVFWNEGGRCERWVFRRRPRGLRLERRERHAQDGGVVEVYSYHGFDESQGDLEMYAVGGEQHWVRRPRGNLGIGLGGVGGVGMIDRIQFVRVDREAIEWVVSSGNGKVVAYHPADSSAWYRSRAACKRDVSRQGQHERK